jgi:hypothetical protein
MNTTVSDDDELVEPDVWGTVPHPGDPSYNADPSDTDGAHDHPHAATAGVPPMSGAGDAGLVPPSSSTVGAGRVPPIADDASPGPNAGERDGSR